MSTGQIIVVAAGVVLATLGIALLLRSGPGDAKEKEAGVQSALLSISGPPGLLIALAGVVLFVYPFTPLWPGDNSSSAGATTTLATNTTTPAANTTTPAANTTESTPPADDSFDEVVREGEAGSLTSPMGTGSDAAASGGSFVVSSERDLGAVELTFEVEGGVYAVWARAAADADHPGSSDSFKVMVDGGAIDIWDLFHTTGNPPTNWTWDRVSLRCGGTFDDHVCDPWTVPLEAGEHKITFIGLEPESKLDVVVITRDLEDRPKFAE